MNNISPKTIWRLQVQGFADYTEEQMAKHRFGIRFPYLLCAAIMALGVAFVHIPTLIFLAIAAFFSILLPYHSFDYLYNYGVRYLVKRPFLPPRRSPQIKFACSVATVWIIVTIYLFSIESILAGQILGGSLVAIALLVGLTDICIPSMFYNLITKRKINPYENTQPPAIT